MNKQKKSFRTHNEIYSSLRLISQAMYCLDDQYVCVLHCMQQRRSKFYEEIKEEFSVRIFPCKHGGGIKANIAQAVVGYSALIVVDQFEILPPLFLRVAEQAMASIYVVQKSTLASTLNLLGQLSATEIFNRILQDPMHFLYQVDEDSATEDGLVVEIVGTGEKCPRALCDVAT